MARHNTCTNPALSNNTDGWSGGSIPVRTAVTGFDRPFAARYSSDTFSNSARGAVTGGTVVTLSQYVYIDNAAPTINGTLFIEWRDSGGGVISYDSAGYSIPGQTVSRQSATFTAPASAVEVSLISSGYNFATGAGDFTQVLVEESATLLDYFDGDSPNASWDGTPGNSASTLADAGVTGVMAVTLPALIATLTGVVTVEGELNAVLPALQAVLTGTSDVVPVRPGTITPRNRRAAMAAVRERRGVRMEGG